MMCVFATVRTVRACVFATVRTVRALSPQSQSRYFVSQNYLAS